MIRYCNRAPSPRWHYIAEEHLCANMPYYQVIADENHPSRTSRLIGQLIHRHCKRLVVVEEAGHALTEALWVDVDYANGMMNESKVIVSILRAA